MTKDVAKSLVIPLAEAMAKLPPLDTQSLRYADLFKQGSALVEFYSPIEVDKQTPHELDELYVIVSGNGSFECEGETRPFGPGDAIFVAAHAHHRFFDFSSNFATWVIFFQSGTHAEVEAS